MLAGESQLMSDRSLRYGHLVTGVRRLASGDWGSVTGRSEIVRNQTREPIAFALR